MADPAVLEAPAALPAGPPPVAAGAGLRPTEVEAGLRPDATAGAIWFDVSDLLGYFHASRTPTGIQRVQLNILREALAADQGGRLAACAYELTSGAWKPVAPALFLRLAALSRSGGDVEAPEWRAALAALAEALHQAAPCAFAPGSSLVNLGSSWWQQGYMHRVCELKRRHGLRYIPFLYDCIPLLQPQHCAATLVDEFARWFAQLCLCADGVVVISESTRRDFERLREQVLPDVAIPVFTLPLDADARLAAEAEASPAQRGRPYVLFVATLESRKNHLLVFRAWQALIRRHGAAAVPELVCVGKQGWLAEPAFALHAGDPALRAQVTLLHGVPDIELAGLYRGCLFTLFNSFYEGWGLPVTESFSYGKVALVADNSSLPEAGAGGAVFFATDDLDDLLAKLEAMLFQPGFLEAQEARLQREVRLRDWSELAAQLARHVATAAQLTLPNRRATMRPGEVWETRLLPGPRLSLQCAAADLLREGEGWGALEPWGCWAKPGRLALRLPLAEMPGQAPLRVLVQFVGPPVPWRIGLRAGPASGITRDFTWLEGAASQVVFCAFEIPSDAWPEVLVEFEAPEGGPLSLVTPGDDRVVGLGLLHVMVCRADDYAARLDYLETRTLGCFVRI